ncbi:MAG: hypothetical protein D6701_00895 [Gemmatimonadetes bacterium]|nr:MAG: hypothetical protein D6701_00895 [Gemmatimonadota bacterium]
MAVSTSIGAAVRSVSVVLTAALTAAACASGGSGGGEPAAPAVLNVAGVYEGAMNVEGTTIPGTLELVQTGTSIAATFSAPDFGITAEGGGTLTDTLLQLDLSYNFQCPGQATLTGQVAPETMRYAGELLASDCTGDVAGDFSFTRR